MDHEEGWTPKNHCFQIVVMEKILGSSMDYREIKPVNPKKNQYPEYSFEGLLLKLKLQYFGHLIQKKQLTGKDPDAGKDWRQKWWGQQRTRWLDITVDSMDMNLSKLQEFVHRSAQKFCVSVEHRRGCPAAVLGSEGVDTTYWLNNNVHECVC